MSAPFDISRGVRQDGVLSTPPTMLLCYHVPVLLSVRYYVDELIVKLRSSGYGIYIGSLFMDVCEIP